MAGFLPPFAPSVYKAMSSRQGGYDYLKALPKVLKPLFDGHGFGFEDFTDPAVLGFSDAEYVDGLHASEKVYQELNLKMLPQKPLA